jgi:hypothetical protein
MSVVRQRRKGEINPMKTRHTQIDQKNGRLSHICDLKKGEMSTHLDVARKGAPLFVFHIMLAIGTINDAIYAKNQTNEISSIVVGSSFEGLDAPVTNKSLSSLIEPLTLSLSKDETSESRQPRKKTNRLTELFIRSSTLL